MPTVNIKDVPEFKMTKHVDLSEDSINKIVEAVAQKIAEPIRHGHWTECKDRHSWECSVCHTWSVVGGHYCDWCGAKMDEVEEE